MLRNHPFASCKRRIVPRRLRAEIMLRQEGRCADCGTRLIIGFFVFDHRPPLALREEADDANDPERLPAPFWTCDQQKTPKDLKEIAKTKRLSARHQDFVARQQDKVPGRRVPTQKERLALERAMQRARDLEAHAARDEIEASDGRAGERS